MHSWTGFSLTIPLFKLFPGLPSGIFFSSTAFLGGIFFFLGADAYVRAWGKTRRKVGGENWREAGWEKTGIKEKKEAGGSLVGGVMQWRGGEMTFQPTLCCSPGPCPLGGRGRAQSPGLCLIRLHRLGPRRKARPLGLQVDIREHPRFPLPNLKQGWSRFLLSSPVLSSCGSSPFLPFSFL